MKRLILLLTLTASFAVAFAAEHDYRLLLPKLDETIDNSPSYVEARTARINMLKRQLKNAKGGEQRYGLSMKLFDEYKAFVNDSAVHYINLCVKTAHKMGRKDREGMALSLLAFQCANTGMYYEGLEMLKLVEKDKLDKDGLTKYYHAYVHLYSEMGFYSALKEMRDKYYKLSFAYRDSLYATADRFSDEYMTVKTMELHNAGKFSEALKLNDVWLSVVADDSRRIAIVAYYRQLLYNAKGDFDERKYWLTLSALNDVKNAVMDQASLWSLAEHLCSDGDLKHAYKYIRFSWETTTMFGARVRSQQVMPILAVIEQDYQTEISDTNNKLRLSIALVTLMVVSLLLLLIYVNRQRHRLLTARRELKSINKQLDILNQDLKNANANLDDRNRQLSSANAEMALTNDKLNDSNRVKEEFIGKFMVLCSRYIDKMDTLRKSVNKMTKARKFDELITWSKSTELKEKEIDELLANFDEVFLFLFPNFVEDFNALLREDCRIIPSEQGRLNTSLRIFALIRLGIDDSSRISEFLHYSVNTIYNYRARIKNGAQSDRENFERNVKLLGLGYQ